MLVGGVEKDGRRNSESRRQVVGFICADAPDLPTEDPQERYRLGTREVQER